MGRARDRASADLNGQEFILDADADTSISADTDDQIDIKIAGADDFQFTANTFTAQSGSTIAAQALTATTITTSSTIDVNGNEIILDADADTSITADTDDQIDLRVGGIDTFVVKPDVVEIKGSHPDLKLTDSDDTNYGGLFYNNGAINLSADHDATGATGQINFVIDGSTKTIINSAGNVGIGVTPSSWHSNWTAIDFGDQGFIGHYDGGDTQITTNLYHDGSWKAKETGTSANYTIGAAGYHVWYGNPSASANAAVTMTERMRINSDGRVGIGDAGQTNTGMTITQTVSSATLKVTNGTDNYTGNNIWSVLGDNTNDTDCFLYAGYSANGHRFFVAGNGNVTNANNSYGSYSDEKLKENISDASSQWDDIKGLKVRNFSWKADSLDKANMIGLIAQEAEKISPNLIEVTKDTNTILTIKDENKTVKDENGNTIDNPNYGKDIPNPEFGEIIEGQTTKTLKYSVLYMKAIKALQEAMERIETLEAEVKALKEQ